MLKPRLILRMFLVGLMVLGVSAVSGQNYPNKPIRIVTAPVGSGVDFSMRLIAPEISAVFGQPLIVENRPSGIIPGDTVAKAPPDGYTLLYAANVFMYGPLLEKTPYDPVTDFLPITLTAISPSILVVTPSLPVKSVMELITLAKTRPGGLTYSTGGTGGAGHLTWELFRAMTGVNFLRVPYANTTQEITDLMSGQVQLTISAAAALAPHIKSGKVKALAVTSAQPSALFSELPTVAATVPGFEAVSIYGVFAPAKTPATIINRLNQEIVRVLNRADIKEKYLSAGLEVVGSSPQELASKMKSEIAKWAKVIRDAGIKTN